MKRDFRLNDRASCRDASGRLFDLSYVTFSQSGGKTRRARSKFSSEVEVEVEVFRGRSKGKKILHFFKEILTMFVNMFLNVDRPYTTPFGQVVVYL